MKGRLRSGQALVEFMLIIPVLLLVIWGVIESGHLFAVYAGMTSASREASRYGASVGDNGGGTPRYLDCAGIRDAARRVALFSFLSDADVQIVYDEGNPALPLGSCDTSPDPDTIVLGDRVVVTVNTTYRPLVPLVPVPPMNLTSSTARTILKEVAVGPTPTLGGPLATFTSTASPTPTSTFTATATATATSTATSTIGPSPTATQTETPTVTNTPSPSPTPIPVPQNFSASMNNCEARKISFTWDSVPGADYYAIYKVAPAPVTQITSDTDSPCKNCDVLPFTESSRSYYVVAVVNGHQSGPSNIVTASCP